MCSVDAVCKNTLGSFKCICKEGYHGNGRICKGKCLYYLSSLVSIFKIIDYFDISDVNECSQNKHECPKHSKCRNTPGSYTCKCKSGFKKENGRCLGKICFCIATLFCNLHGYAILFYSKILEMVTP